jgi:hypothetical protein
MADRQPNLSYQITLIQRNLNENLLIKRDICCIPTTDLIVDL